MGPGDSQYAAEHLREALAQDRRVGELGLCVRVDANRVVVTGTVTTKERSDAVAEVIHQSFPEAEVCAELDIANDPGPEGVERLS